jgi:hypothetical protein
LEVEAIKPDPAIDNLIASTHATDFTRQRIARGASAAL